MPHSAVSAGLQSQAYPLNRPSGLAGTLRPALAQPVLIAVTLPAMTEDDPREAIELENAAEARLRKVDANPADTASAAAAQHLLKLANEVRQLRDGPIYR